MVPLEIFSLLYKFFIAILLGALIGVEREKSHLEHKGTDFAGIRTFMLITFLGCLSAYLSTLFYDWLLAVIFVCYALIVLTGYAFSSYFNKEIGMTTELSTIITFLLGVLVFMTSEIIPTIMAIILTLILSFKSYIHQFVYNLKSNEFFDTMKFLVIAFVILPLLKNISSFGPYNSINLYEIWLMVVFVSAISYVGYILIKLFGANQGTFFTGLLGGILSSTAVVTTLANKSKEENKEASPFVVSAIIACSTMFLRLLVEVSILNLAIIEKLALPFVLLALAGYISASIMWKNHNHADTVVTFSSPLMLKPALKFGLFYAFASIISNISGAYNGAHGLIIAALITGLADADATAIYVARHPETGIELGLTAIIIAALVNTGMKMAIAKFFGSKEFGINFVKAMIPVLITGLVLLFLIVR